MQYDWEYQQTHYKRGGIFRFITALARLSGLIALIGLGFLNYLEWSLNSREDFRIYLIIMTIIVGYLEVLWILDKFVTCCICCFRSETCFYWMCCFLIDNWVKAILYVGFSIPLLCSTFIFKYERIDFKVIGVLLNVAAILYFTKSFKYKRIDDDEVQEDTNLNIKPTLTSRPSISTQTSTLGINNDTFPSAFNLNQQPNS